MRAQGTPNRDALRLHGEFAVAPSPRFDKVSSARASSENVFLHQSYEIRPHEKESSQKERDCEACRGTAQEACCRGENKTQTGQDGPNEAWAKKRGKGCGGNEGGERFGGVTHKIGTAAAENSTHAVGGRCFA